MIKKTALMISLTVCLVFAAAFTLTGCGDEAGSASGENETEPAAPESVQIEADENAKYNCIETADSVICCDENSIYKYDKKADEIERVVQDKGAISFMKVNDGMIYYVAGTGNGIGNNSQIYSLDPITCKSTKIADEVGDGYFDIVDGMFYFKQYVNGEDVEPPYTIQMKPDGTAKKKTSDYEIGEAGFSSTVGSNSEDYRVDNEIENESWQLYSIYKLYTPDGIKYLNSDSPIAYFLSVCEIGNDFASIDKKYGIKGNGGAVTDALHKYTGRKTPIEFLFIATIPTDIEWDYKIADTDKCIGMYGTAKNLLGIEEEMSIESFCEKANLMGYSPGSGTGLESAGYDGTCIDVAADDGTHCVMLLRDVEDTVSPETKVYVDISSDEMRLFGGTCR